MEGEGEGEGSCQVWGGVNCWVVGSKVEMDSSDGIGVGDGSKGEREGCVNPNAKITIKM